MSKTVFLSTVSSEFGVLRRRLARLAERTKRCHIRHQDDFFHRGVRTLRKLVEEVQESDFVFHVIGDEPGWRVPAEQAIEYLDQNQEFGSGCGDTHRFQVIARYPRNVECPRRTRSRMGRTRGFVGRIKRSAAPAVFLFRNNRGCRNSSLRSSVRPTRTSRWGYSRFSEPVGTLTVFLGIAHCPGMLVVPEWDGAIVEAYRPGRAIAQASPAGFPYVE